MKKKVLDLNDREEAEKEIRSYLELECPHYLGSKPASVELVHDVAIKLFEGEERSRVLVYDVKLQDKSEAFGTIGGILYPHHPPYSNVFPKTQVKDADTAASMHLYWEAHNRYGNTSLFGKKENLEELAEMLEIPKELRLSPTLRKIWVSETNCLTFVIRSFNFLVFRLWVKQSFSINFHDNFSVSGREEREFSISPSLIRGEWRQPEHRN